MKLSLLLALSLSASICAAQGKSKAQVPAAPELTMREKAIAESQSESKKQVSASDAQVSGMLTLKDPRPEVVTRSWSYFAAFTGQAFQAEGTVSKEGSGVFNLGNNSQTFMPGLELGVISTPLQTKALLWKFGVRAKAGFTSQETDVKLESGYEINDARLNTTVFSGGPVVAMSWDRFDWLSLTVSPQFGTVIYTQSSSNDFAAFSKQASFESWGYGLDVALSKKWSVFTEYSQKSLKGSNEIALQRDNFELGTKVTW
ncbi:hypothetical protein ACLWBD_04255 [Bdellovibrio sp. HCB117]|nr:hypothetical protein [Bdellovibrio bacteriovorus]